MERQAAPTISKSLILFYPWLIILIAILFVSAIRIRLLETPLTRDEGEYAYAGQLILQGIPPYKLAYNMKLPGTYLAYAIGMKIFGETPTGIHLTLLVANCVTIVFVFLLGRKIFGSVAAIVAAVSYAIMTLSAAVGGLTGDANHFVVLFAVPAILLLLKAGQSHCLKKNFASGMLFGLAFLMKQQGICFAIFGIAFLFSQAISKQEFLSKRFAVILLTFAAGLSLPFIFTCLWLAIAGVFGRFWFWTISYALDYETEVPIKMGIKDYLLGHLQQTQDLSIGFWAITLAGMIAVGFEKKMHRPMMFVVMLWLFSFLGTAAGFYFRGHYFILVLPAFALLIGMSVAALQSVWRFQWLSGVFKSLPLITFSFAVTWMIYYQAQSLFVWPASYVDQSYLRNPVLEAFTAAKLIRENSSADTKIAVIGSEPEIYFYAQRHSATGYIYTYALMEPQPHALEMQHDMANEIELNRPEYLVQVPYYLSWLPKRESNNYISDWFEHYSIADYEKVGVIGYNSDGNFMSAWENASKKLPTLPTEHITIFRRKVDQPVTTQRPF